MTEIGVFNPTLNGENRPTLTMQEIHKTPASWKVEIPVSEKYILTINEAAAYFSIGVKKSRRMAEDNKGKFAVTMGSR